MLKYYGTLFGSVLTVAIACISWIFSFKKVVLPLVAAVILLLIVLIVWLCSNIFCLFKDNANKTKKICQLRDGLKATKVARNEVQGQRNSLERKYSQLQSNYDRLFLELKTITYIKQSLNLEDKNGKRKNISDNPDR